MWPCSSEFWESASKWLLTCFHLLCLDWNKLWPQGRQAEERNKERSQRWNYEIQKRKKCFNKPSAHVCSLYLGTGIQCLKSEPREVRKTHSSDQRDDLRQEVVSSCCPIWEEPRTNPWPLQLWLLIVINIHLMHFQSFYNSVQFWGNSFGILIDWCSFWVLRVEIRSPCGLA